MDSVAEADPLELRPVGQRIGCMGRAAASTFVDLPASKFLGELFPFAASAVLLDPLGHFAQCSRRFEADKAPAGVEGKALFVQRSHDPPGVRVAIWRCLEVEPHVHHRPRALWANDLPWHMLQLLPVFERPLIHFLPLPMLERLPAVEAGKVVSVVMPGVTAHGDHSRRHAADEKCKKQDLNPRGVTATRP